MSSGPSDCTALIPYDPYPSLQPRACLVGWEMGRVLPILGSFRICKMGLIIVLISYGVLKHPRTVPGMKEALYKCTSQNKVKYISSFIEYLPCVGHRLGVLLPEDGARPLPSRSPPCLLGDILPSSPHAAVPPLEDSSSFTCPLAPHQPCRTRWPFLAPPHVLNSLLRI